MPVQEASQTAPGKTTSGESSNVQHDELGLCARMWSGVARQGWMGWGDNTEHAQLSTHSHRIKRGGGQLSEFSF